MSNNYQVKVEQSYAVIIHKEGGMYWGSAPDVPSAFSTGETVEALLVHMKEAIELALATTNTALTLTKSAE
ncbi:type II toxin-antitoxin system HicB family antitoxin [Fructobacillus sp. W13]|uniref:Type II toxin-antitoxin system HicB family antitoxin n=1 Tax=Fructobacillus apis TaxID=2935017 RepID=A0ABT0ZP50_9LACO|nr:type II toxin-antitoxin system HicB family antitoxin [Fructobacillus apis]MCO0831776.1 type II toxin-antitoxin system HicB family antitoxin [Fructobacillus apis]